VLLHFDLGFASWQFVQEKLGGNHYELLFTEEKFMINFMHFKEAN